MSLRVFDEYLSIGGNRQTAASAWSRVSGALAFGADQNVAIWFPAKEDQPGIRHLLNGHQDKVTAVSFLEPKNESQPSILISGSADGVILVWSATDNGWHSHCRIKAHEGSITVIDCLDDTNIFATGASNHGIRLWKFVDDQIELISEVTPKSRMIPLALALGTFPSFEADQGLFLVVGGTKNDINIYVMNGKSDHPVTKLEATLRGHEGWIRSLAMKSTPDHGLLLASASADKYVRLWKFRPGDFPTKNKPSNDYPDVEYDHLLQAKTQKISIAEISYSITFEALLLGHEDWVYSAAWNPACDSGQLLTASADGTLAIWEPDTSSGIWITTSKLGEISGQKGATTATGSSGGFWNALWSPDGGLVTCLGRTGSWRIWKFDQHTTFWQQVPGISGHTSSVNGLAWSSLGQYLLSTSSDQTTRLHAEWRDESKRSWHEFSRPQIHGYDLNCISSTNSHQFVSGADEKLLRVFNEPKDIAIMLKKLCDVETTTDANLPDMAAIPVLGLSNKAVGEKDDSFTEVGGGRDQDYVASSVLESSLASLREPPNEDILSRHTLWPEHEKLYGHGYEISEGVACEKYLATACKASSLEHAVVRIYDTATWAEMKPPLQAHTLTITRLAWSNASENYLLSVGRDRQWSVFGPGASNHSFQLLQSNAKAHTRMIMDAAWSPVKGRLFFATASRDKTIKLWHSDQHAIDFKEKLVIKRDNSVTAISLATFGASETVVLAAGEENGTISLHVLDIAQTLSIVRSFDIPVDKCPTKSINRLAWRDIPTHDEQDTAGKHLAVASADGSVRLLRIEIETLR